METLSADEERLKRILFQVHLECVPSCVDLNWLTDRATSIGGIYQLGLERVQALQKRIEEIRSQPCTERFGWEY